MPDQLSPPHGFFFDEAYYRKYYEDPQTCVIDKEGYPALSDFLFSYLRYLQVPVARVLDIGCGIGLWRHEVLRHCSSVQYVGVEKSAHACQEYGWQPGCITNFQTAERFDLVICHGVLQYLNDDDAEIAIHNLASLTKSALHLKVITSEDWESNCDQERTDGRVYLRSVSWYRNRLKHHFLACGGGLFLSKSSTAVLFELEYLA